MEDVMTKAKNVHQRLAEAMRVVSYIQKERKQGMQYTITSHDAVTAKVRPALLDAGIVYYPVRCDHTQNGNRAECTMTVRFVNIDEPSDFFDVPTFGYGIDGQDKGPGKAMSYAVKYALLKALGLETGDDPDEQNIDHDKRDPAEPPFDAPTEAERIKKRLRGAESLDALGAIWREENATIARVKAADAALEAQIVNLKDQRKTALVAPDLGGDTVPYQGAAE
jgi:hypothetical protein